MIIILLIVTKDESELRKLWIKRVSEILAFINLVPWTKRG